MLDLISKSAHKTELSDGSSNISGQSATCGMCLNLSMRSDAAPWDTPILQSEHFVALPSLGALVPGWVLILPRSHFLNLARLPAELQADFDAFRRTVRTSVQEV